MAGTIMRPLARFVLIVEAAAVSVVVAEEVITAVATTGTLSRTPTGDSRRASRTAPKPELPPPPLGRELHRLPRRKAEEKKKKKKKRERERKRDNIFTMGSVIP